MSKSRRRKPAKSPAAGRKKSPAKQATGKKLDISRRLQAIRGPVTAPLAENDPWISGSGGGAVKTGPLRFFVVDDDPSMVEMMTALIEKDGHTVHSSNSSLTALAEILVQKPDVLVVDLMMPDLDGIDLCSMLRAKPSTAEMKIIVVSAKSYEFDRKRALGAGADGFIQKPISADTFMPRIARIIADKVDLTFWGVRGTLPVTGGKSLRYGGNTSCVTLEFPNHQLFVFDAGSGIKNLSDHLIQQRRARIEAKIFISHPHWDHINALPFFVPLYMPGNDFEILGARHGDTTTRLVISAQMDGVYFPITFQEFGARVYFHDLDEEEINFGRARVKTMLLSHPGRCLGYRVDYNGRSFCYITDNELFLEDNPHYNPHYVAKLTRFIEGADAVVTDTTYTEEEYATKIGWGHSCVGEAVKLAHDARVKNLFLFHHDPDQSDTAIDHKLEMAERQLAALRSKTQVIAPQEGQLFRL
ncbi:MAG: response regulator [Alphaproteobacteria bacterium]|nr:response regulator [Alphaproteobacteria bacterium]